MIGQKTNSTAGKTITQGIEKNPFIGRTEPHRSLSVEEDRGKTSIYHLMWGGKLRTNVRSKMRR